MQNAITVCEVFMFKTLPRKSLKTTRSGFNFQGKAPEPPTTSCFLISRPCLSQQLRSTRSDSKRATVYCAMDFEIGFLSGKVLLIKSVTCPYTLTLSP